MLDGFGLDCYLASAAVAGLLLARRHRSRSRSPAESLLFDAFDPRSRRSHYTVKHTFCAKGCLPLWVADQELALAPSIHAALRARAMHPTFGYTIQPDLVWERVARWLAARHAWQGLTPRDFVFTSNLVSSTVNGIRAFTRAGDAVCVLLPLYHPLQALVVKSGRTLVTQQLVLSETTGRYEIDFEKLRAAFNAHSVKLLIWCSPHNPGGRVWTRSELRRVVEICQSNDAYIISDEIHSDLILPSSSCPHTPLAVVARDDCEGYAAERVMTMSGPGKTWNIAGLHCGFVIMQSAALRAKYLAVAEHAFLHYGSVFATTALLAAYSTREEVTAAAAAAAGSASASASAELRCNVEGGSGGDPAAWLELLLLHLDRNVDLVVRVVRERMPQLKVMRPGASYLVWLDCEELQLDGVPPEGEGEGALSALMRFFTEQAKVQPSPGFLFGGEATSHFIRLNIACPTPYLEEALQRIALAYQELMGERRRT